MKKIALLICSVVIVLGLSACGGGASSGSASSTSETASSSAVSQNLSDYGWVSFEMPDGWEDANESDKYETIRDSANTRHMMKIAEKSLSSSYPNAAALAEKEVKNNADRYTDEGTKKIGDYEWSLVGFTFNNNPSVIAIANINSERAVQVTIYEITIDDPEAQTVLSSLKIDEAKIW